DYDNDGNLDLAVANRNFQTNRVYRNNGDETFALSWNSAETESTDILVWGDFDNDGVLDLAAGNRTGETNRVYQGIWMGANAAPSPPIGLAGSVALHPALSTVTFKWDGGDYDANGVTETVHYAIAVATVPMTVSGDGLMIVYPSSAPTSDSSTFTFTWTGGSPLLGKHLRPAFKVWPGDSVEKHGIMLSTGANMGNLQLDTTYYFRVQAIDAGLRRGQWSTESEIYVPDAFWYSVWNSVEEDQTKSLVWADFDCDGDLDLAAANDNSGTNRVYRNNGDGTFAQTWKFLLATARSRFPSLS
ncbi:FG-GAP repeat domain-containing protein, partial [Elusimicrobiota bacterium]